MKPQLLLVLGALVLVSESPAPAQIGPAFVKIRFGLLDTTCYPSCLHPSEWKNELYADLYDSVGTLIPPSTSYYYNWGVDFCRGFGLQYGWAEGYGRSSVTPDGNKLKTEVGCCVECPFQSYNVAVEVTVNGEILRSAVVRIPNIALPADIGLSQNYPNPFNGITQINFWVSQPSTVRLEVYNLLSKKIGDLVWGRVRVGFYSAPFDGEGMSSGIYFYRMTVQPDVGKPIAQTRKMVLIR